MKVTVDVNINAPELSASILALATAMTPAALTQATQFTQGTIQTQTEQGKLDFKFKLQDAKPETEAPKPAETKPGPHQEPATTQETTTETEPGAPTVTLEQVRAKLAALSQAGKQAEVKKLITDCGATKLTDIPAEKYGALLAAAEGI